MHELYYKRPYMEAVFTGFSICVVCGCKFPSMMPHPADAMFVNGYPAICTNAGRIPIMDDYRGELPWSQSEVTYRMTLI